MSSVYIYKVYITFLKEYTEKKKRVLQFLNNCRKVILCIKINTYANRNKTFKILKTITNMAIT